MSVVIRPADSSDAALYAWALDEASDGFLRMQFGSRTRDILATSSLKSGSEFSLDHVRIAQIDDEPVGVCSSYAPASLNRSASDVLSETAGLAVIRAGLVGLLARPVNRQLEWHDDGDWYIQCLAVRPTARNHGVGSALLEDARHRAIDSGAEWLTLDVDANNEAARRLYERAGFTVVATSKPARLLGGVQLHRMAVDLIDQ